MRVHGVGGFEGVSAFELFAPYFEAKLSGCCFESDPLAGQTFKIDGEKGRVDSPSHQDPIDREVVSWFLGATYLTGEATYSAEPSDPCISDRMSSQAEAAEL